MSMLSNKLHLPFNTHSHLGSRLSNPFNLQNTFIADSLKPDLYSEYLQKSAGEKEDVFAGINESLSALVCNTDTAITNTFNTINTSLQLASKSVNDVIDGSLDKLKLSFSSGLSGLSNNTKGVSSKAGVVVVDGLRYAIVTVETVLAQGVMLVGYAYAYVKDMLPAEIQDVLNGLEDVLRPVGTAFQQVCIVYQD